MMMTQSPGKSLKRLAFETGIRVLTLRHYCENGQITGARRHPLTKQWLVYPPCLLNISGGDLRPSIRQISNGSDKYAI